MTHPPTRRSLVILTLGLLGVSTVARQAAAADLVELVKQVEHAVVRVDTDGAFGSGVIVDNRGYVFTNYHVIDDASKATITLRSGEVLQCKGLLAFDRSRDLAVLKTDEIKPPSAIKIAPQPPSVGAAVAAFGNPRGFSFSTSEGIVAAVRSGAELARTIGDEIYREMGYTENAEWIQTTAPISGGNSGGPLVNMQGDVVGLNTWRSVGGQNLNFAISATDMRRLLATVDPSRLTDFDKLPKKAAPVVRRDTPYDDIEWSVELPTGRVFTFAIFEPEADVTRLMQAKNDDVVVIKHRNGAVYAAASHEGGVLHGLTVAQHESKSPMAIMTYQEGKRHGNLLTFDEKGDAVLFAQYLNGRRHGFECLFQEGDLVLLNQYKFDRPEYIQLVKQGRLLEGFDDLAKAEKHAAAKQLLAQLDEAETEIKRNEIDFRKQVSAYEREARRARARELAPEKRARIRARANQRAAQGAAFLREMYRRAYGR